MSLRTLSVLSLGVYVCVGVRGGLVIFFISACFRRVLGLIFVSFIYLFFLFLACLNTEFCSL